MANDENLLTVSEYGKIHIALKEVIEKKGVSRTWLAKTSGTKLEVINRWYQDNLTKLDLDILARICYVLECRPEEIIIHEVPLPEQTDVK